MVPHKPKKCMGCFPKRFMNQSVMRSRKPLKKTISSKFSVSILSSLVLYYLLTNFIKALICSKYRNIAVHLSMYVNGFNHFFSICLESAIEVMKIDSRYASSCPIKKFRRNVFKNNRIVTFLFPTRN